jgi:hypothetical protein
MHVVFDLLWHGKNDNVLDVIEIEALRSDTRRNHDVLGTGLEGFDGILAFLLRCNNN